MHTSYIEWIRGQVGHRKIPLAFASIVLKDEQGRVLLQHRTDFNIWGLPGGIMELAESILDCAHRELFEETGLTAGELRLVGLYTDPQWDTTYPNGDQVQQYTVCFQGTIEGGEMRPDGIETSAQAFFEISDIPLDQIPAYYAAMLQDALRGGEPAFSPPFTLSNPTPQIESIRPLIGTAPYIGVGAAAVIVGQDRRLLMVRRSDDGHWDFPGGTMNMGENAAQTAVRETWEECGLQIVPERILGIYSPTQAWIYPNGDQTQPVTTLFRARVTGGKPRADQVEACSIAWMAPQEILQLDHHPMIRPLFQAVVKHLDQGYFLL